MYSASAPRVQVPFKGSVGATDEAGHPLPLSSIQCSSRAKAEGSSKRNAPSLLLAKKTPTCGSSIECHIVTRGSIKSGGVKFSADGSVEF